MTKNYRIGPLKVSIGWRPFGRWPHIGFYLYFGSLEYSRYRGLTIGLSFIYIAIDLDLSWRYND